MDPIELRTANGLQLGSVKLWRFLTCSNACLARAKSLYTKMWKREYAFEPLSMWKLEMFCCAKYRFWARHLPFPKSFFNVFNIFWLFCALFRFDGFWTHNYCIYIPTIAQLCTIWDLFSEANSKREVEEEHRWILQDHWRRRSPVDFAVTSIYSALVRLCRPRMVLPGRGIVTVVKYH